jgi:hypothetical protein
MAEKKINSTFALLIITVTAVFLVVEALIWGGVIQVSALGNLGNGLDKLLENPAFVGLLATLVDGTLSGFMQNVLKKNDTYSVQKFGETFFYYEPLMILVAQFIPISYGVVLLFVIQVFRRTIAKIVPAKTT